jgi:hypothetical protein
VDEAPPGIPEAPPEADAPPAFAPPAPPPWVPPSPPPMFEALPPDDDAPEVLVPLAPEPPDAPHPEVHPLPAPDCPDAPPPGPEPPEFAVSVPESAEQALARATPSAVTATTLT